MSNMNTNMRGTADSINAVSNAAVLYLLPLPLLPYPHTGGQRAVVASNSGLEGVV
jgi:hypothetical protein